MTRGGGYFPWGLFSRGLLTGRLFSMGAMGGGAIDRGAIGQVAIFRVAIANIPFVHKGDIILTVLVFIAACLFRVSLKVDSKLS